MLLPLAHASSSSFAQHFFLMSRHCWYIQRMRRRCWPGEINIMFVWWKARAIKHFPFAPFPRELWDAFLRSFRARVLHIHSHYFTVHDLFLHSVRCKQHKCECTTSTITCVVFLSLFSTLKLALFKKHVIKFYYSNKFSTYEGRLHFHFFLSDLFDIKVLSSFFWWMLTTNE